jgi:glycosyltransferase involved in cell wall biosynthesis
MIIYSLIVASFLLVITIVVFKIKLSFIYTQISNQINLFLYGFFWKIRNFLPLSFKKKYVLNWKLTHRRKKSLYNLAIFNENRQKYTETFVSSHLDNLKFNKVFYYGLPPQYIFPWGDVISSNQQWKQFKLAFLKLVEIDEQSYFSNKLAKSLKKQKIQLALAEFGTMGAQVCKACLKNNIPLVVIFHGYDAWHKEIIERNKEKYIELFKYSNKIIGVSEDICQQLQKLGCPKEKVFYLPCSINFKLFSYKDHTNNPPQLLSVGRFSETKSPHLTILAFNEVLKEVPEAKLVMVGKDGGGELFEACHILARALNIEDKVDFKGILTPNEVKIEMDKASVFVQHSITTPLNGDKEGTPVSVMEAMACGLPVVATNHAGISELIQSGKNGFLVEEYDYLEMAEKIILCLSNLDLAFSIGQNASLSLSKNKLIAENNSILNGLLNEIVNLGL